ncbi:MAG: S46 family peptidase [Sphingobacteriales bacterium]|nr:S46 family peptidase [Sphingobacteriales bacterium]
MKQLRYFIVLIFVSILSLVARADEGMWLPLLLQQLNEKQMKAMGMKISAKDIYSINNGSLKDAILQFGGGCTGEVISSKGLVLTNHHCGFDAIQNHSTLDHNYIRDGYWAANYGQELPNPGLSVTFIVRIEDISKQVLSGVTSAMSERERQSAIDRNIAEIRKSAQKESYQDILVRPFFEGNQYFLFVTETYKDIRLVGAPPSSIGNFGKDTDNWVWPRHTGDFSIFRIYAGKDNKPAAYSANNVPYVPKRSLAISLDGVAENDFTMVFGFPGRTTEYLHSAAVEQIMTVNDPAKIAIREKALNIIDGFMRKDEQIKIQYAAKYAGIQNAYKKWQGEVLGLTKTDAVGKKKMYEAEFQKRVNANPGWTEEYGRLLNDLEYLYKELKPFGLARDYFNEIVSKIELFAIASRLNSIVGAYEDNGEVGGGKDFPEKLASTRSSLEALFDEYNVAVDKKLFEVLMEMYMKDQAGSKISSFLRNQLEGAGQNNLAKPNPPVFDAGDFTKKEFVMSLLNKPAEEMVKTIKESKLIGFYNEMLRTYQEETQIRLNEMQGRINRLQRFYMQAQMEVFREKTFYPDANSTMRITYGKVKGYEARDAVAFDYYTYLDGVMEKYKPGDYEFDVPEKLRTLYRNKDYGQYGQKGKMPVCFIAANHTTGGNSGSPALDAYGNLIGLNFDRVWEGTMSDINYDPSICRNIMVDARYVLFIIDKFAGAGHLVKEMKLVHPKRK